MDGLLSLWDSFSDYGLSQPLWKTVAFGIAAFAIISFLMHIGKDISRNLANNRLYKQFDGPKGPWFFGVVSKVRKITKLIINKYLAMVS